MKTLVSLLLLCAACVSASADIILSDTFTYTNSVLANASAGKWHHTSGGNDQVNVTNGAVELNRNETEDVAATLPISYTSSSGTMLYAKFSVFVFAPDTLANGNYFAHLDGGAARARIFMTTNGTVQGKFRLGLANGSNNVSVVWAVDLNTNQAYTVVMRQVISNATATLWVNPANESASSITAADPATAQSVNAFALRQDTGIGRFTLDDLVVATSFAEALSGNESPSITDIPDQQIGEGASTAALPFVIGDAETAASALTVTVRASNSNLVQSISLGGSLSNRTVTVVAPPGQTGTTTITVFVTDGTTTNSDSFVLTVISSLLFSDDFSYTPGPLITNGTPPWTHHSGNTTGEIQVASGKITLSAAQTEDVNVILPNGPFATNSGAVLYASFLVNFSQRPTSGGDYIAHFNTGTPRCRVFANTANAGTGKFRLGISNGGSSISEQLAIDLATNTTHLVVLRYNPATGISTVWANPSVETDPGTNATDSAAVTSVSAFALREDTAIGTFTVDDVRVGLTFAAVAGSLPSLRIDPLPANKVRIAWPAPSTGFTLQTNGNLSTTNWGNVGAAPAVGGGENVITNTGATNALFFRLKK